MANIIHLVSIPEWTPFSLSLEKNVVFTDLVWWIFVLLIQVLFILYSRMDSYSPSPFRLGFLLSLVSSLQMFQQSLLASLTDAGLSSTQLAFGELLDRYRKLRMELGFIYLKFFGHQTFLRWKCLVRLCFTGHLSSVPEPQSNVFFVFCLFVAIYHSGFIQK